MTDEPPKRGPGRPPNPVNGPKKKAQLVVTFFEDGTADYQFKGAFSAPLINRVRTNIHLFYSKHLNAALVESRKRARQREKPQPETPIGQDRPLAAVTESGNSS